jgi:hypothetical protein
VIYFMQAEGGGPIKIGTSKRLARRLVTLRWLTGQPLKVLAVMPGNRHRERQLHARFSRYRVAGEWFDPSDVLLAFISSEGQP